jgi:hypothetical protein
MFTMEDLMAYFLPMMTGQYKTDNQNLTVQDKQYTNANDLIKMMFSPQFAMMTGTYDPMLAAPAQPEPVAPVMEQWGVIDQYTGSANPDIAYVANGLKSGQLDGITARQMLNNAMSTSLTGVTPEQIESMVSAMEGEVADNSNRYAQYQADVAQAEAVAAAAPRTDPYAEFGLPSPLEQYTAETLPMDAGFVNRRNDEYAAFDAAGAALETAKANEAKDRYQESQGSKPRQTADTAARATGEVVAPKQEGGPRSGVGPRGPGMNTYTDRLVTPFEAPKSESNNITDAVMAMLAKEKLRESKRAELLAAKEPKQPKKAPPQSRAKVAAQATYDRSKNSVMNSDAEAWGMLQNAQASGRNPLTDAMLNRFMSLGMSGQG